MNKKQVGKRIREVRLLREMTQLKLSKKTKFDRFRLSRYENHPDKQLPSATAIFKIAKALNVTSDYLLGLSNQLQELKK